MAELWNGSAPLVLASGSATRRSLLRAAGVPCEVHVAAIDERALEADAGGEGGAAVAPLLARAKAEAVSRAMPGRMVLGADQTLTCEGVAFHKPASLADARATLLALAGRTHALHAAFCIVRDGAVLARGSDTATLVMRALSPALLDAYLAAMGEAATSSVGAYQVEGLGMQLFKAIEGAHSTILGLPMLRLLAALRDLGQVPA